MAIVDYLDEQSGELIPGQDDPNDPRNYPGGSDSFDEGNRRGGSDDPYANLPAGVSRERAEDFIRRNPGDYHRLATAFVGDNQGGPYDRQGPMYDQRTNQLKQGIAAKQNASFGGFTGGGSFGGSQFSNAPYTQLLEQIAKQQLEALQQPEQNPALDKLLAFLDTRFNDLSTNPGYSNEEQALLRTQALEPIERDRAASIRRSTERTAMRGMLPSSGLHELDLRDVDLAHDQLRGAAQRDLGVNAINRRDQNLAQALALGQLSGVQIPQMQRSNAQADRGEQLGLANALYNLPRQALYDNLAVVNGTPGPDNLFGNAIQMLQSQQYQQQLNDQRNAEFWGSLGELFGNLFD
jgi:hypothetical protein